MKTGEWTETKVRNNITMGSRQKNDMYGHPIRLFRWFFKESMVEV
jgi:hypothetical protein